jgi:hypothetical protein
MHTYVSWFARKNFGNKKKSPLVQFAQCLVSGMEPTLCSEAQMSQFDPYETCDSVRMLLRNLSLTPFIDPKNLL